MQARRQLLLLCATAYLSSPTLHAAETLPSAVMTALRGSGLPLKSFGVYMRPVDATASPPQPTLALNDEQPFQLASTAKIVTTLAALQLLGPAHTWRTRAYATAPVANGRTEGDLVIVGGGAGLTPAELSRWFTQMRGEGLGYVSGRIVLDGFALLYPQQPAQAATTAAELWPGGPPDPRTFNLGKAVVTVGPGTGGKAIVTLKPHPADVQIVNDVLMDSGGSGSGCGTRVQWAAADVSSGAAARPQLRVSGRWDASCGRQEIAFVKLPAAVAAKSSVPAPSPVAAAVTKKLVDSIPTATLVAQLWAGAGGHLRGGVIETGQRNATSTTSAFSAPTRPATAWTSRFTTSLPAVVREINKTSDNLAAKSLLLALAPAPTRGSADNKASAGLPGARARVTNWLRAQDLVDDDIRIEEGSGQSHAERGKPRAMVQLLTNAWRSTGSREFVESLPVAGYDGTLANRMRKGAATGHAFLKTGTLSDTRALAGYVMAKSGTVYAVALMVNHAEAARGTPALDALIEWLAVNH